MPLTTRRLLRALRGVSSVHDVCGAAGISEAEFMAARDADLLRRLPPTDARLRAAVRGPVEILRDRAGIPHVYAGATPDLYLGLGYAMAQDRLWQIDRLRRRALGRQAEILGPAYQASDLAHLTVGIDRIARDEVARTDERTRAILDAFCAGVNRWIEACRRRLPIEFAILGYEPAPFAAFDVIALVRGMWWSLNGRIENLVVAEAARLLPTEVLRAAYLTPEAAEHRIFPAGSPYPAAAAPLEPPNEALGGTGDATGSNNWAIAGARATGGHAILCSDPHQGFWVPASWYEYAVHGPEDDAAGAGHVGMPGLWWGSNGRIAWGVTNNAASTRDLYVETVDPTDTNHYREGDGWCCFEKREIEIPVRGAGAARYELRSSVRGPIVNHLLPAIDAADDPPLSLRWVGQEHLDDLRAAVAIGRARDWGSFRDALRDWALPVFNFVYADRTGRVFYQCAGRVPLRGRVRRGFRDAAHPDDRWRGYVPFDALPRLEDPPRGYVASANQRVAPDDYPYPLYGAYAAGHRGVRISQVLDGEARFDRAAMVRLQNDVTSARAQRLVPPLLRRLAGLDDPDARLAREVLGGWDYRYSLESPAPLLFEALVQAWQDAVAAALFPARLVPLVRGQGTLGQGLLAGEDFGWVRGGVTGMFANALRRATARAREVAGDDPAGWRWENVHVAHWKHPLSNEATATAFDVGPAPVDGCGDAIRNTGLGVDPPFSASSGSEYRLVVDFAEPDRLQAVQNIGNSGQPGSPHYRDNFRPWLDGDYHLVQLDRAGVEADLAGKTLLEPAGGSGQATRR